ncbi:flagellar motor protein MotB [Peribacillus cavernae]|uniref:Flagellar motor protein MotB n=1 Tax=Peribacillus cavernae TaxID=1674310 RepID=A0A3S1B1D5_9BACI|nr:flagellar motor protein MotB [Peribacillus cavernae]MDQ0220370.1 chemotaxis protein MotB [Peribacillus cavernae]RUQ25541.1 flagellar motor protein MotB [Peribacillus cavernae]
MAKRKKQKRHEEHVDESWLVPYADILTLLLALFIVLFATSSVDANKFKQLSTVFNQIFNGGTGVMDYQSPVNNNNPSNTNKKEMDQSVNQESGKGIPGKEEEQELAEIQRKVNQYIQKKQLTNKLATSLTEEGLLVTIRDNVLFGSGSADVREEDRKISRDISELLVMNPPRSIIISGHTDNIPIQTSQYDSNWDLSVMRAVNFMKMLLENEKLNPESFSAKGYGEFKPVASNKTDKGRAKNRRVEILIMPRVN